MPVTGVQTCALPISSYAQGVLPGWTVNSSFSAFGQYNVASPAGAFNVDASSYINGAKGLAELSTPLVFDIHGSGFKVGDAELVPFDIDADGEEEYISDLKSLAVLTFDSEGHPSNEKRTGRDLFGSNTDLSAYGINVDGEETYDDGFQALAALVAHLGLIDDTKRSLNAEDLQRLETEIGLGLIVGGLNEGRKVGFAELGITKINLGDAATTQQLSECEEDMWSNRIMRQKGCTFVINSKVRDYADLWFNVQTRAKKEPVKTVTVATLRAQNLAA
jgi:hypothetical protein